MIDISVQIQNFKRLHLKEIVLPTIPMHSMTVKHPKAGDLLCLSIDGALSTLLMNKKKRNSKRWSNLNFILPILSSLPCSSFDQLVLL